jgi:hypothetical protein
LLTFETAPFFVNTLYISWKKVFRFKDVILRKRDLHSFATFRRAEQQFLTDVSVQHMEPINPLTPEFNPFTNATCPNYPGGGEIFRNSPDRPWDPPSFLYNG